MKYSIMWQINEYSLSSAPLSKFLLFFSEMKANLNKRDTWFEYYIFIRLVKSIEYISMLICVHHPREWRIDTLYC